MHDHVLITESDFIFISFMILVESGLICRWYDACSERQKLEESCRETHITDKHSLLKHYFPFWYYKTTALAVDMKISSLGANHVENLPHFTIVKIKYTLYRYELRDKTKKEKMSVVRWMENKVNETLKSFRNLSERLRRLPSKCN